MWTAKLVCLAVLASAPPVSAPVAQDVVVAASAAKPAIMRILEADNLDIETLPASEVAERMSEIRQGAAPAEFWIAYQAHVRAWQDYARAKARAQRVDALSGDTIDGGAIVDARTRINRTFDAVELIAKRFGAWPPRTQTRF
jgi:hypothetical protein